MAHLFKGVTRRQLLRGAAAGGVATIAVSALASCAGNQETPQGSNPVIDDTPVVVEEELATNILTAFSEVTMGLSPTATWELPLGTVLFPAEGTWIPALVAGEAASPMVTANVFSSSSGEMYPVVSKPITQGTNIEIFSARCSDQVFAWVEADLLTHEWWLYASALKDGELQGEPTALWNATGDWDPAQYCCTGRAVIWQVQPSLSGEKTSEFSHAYLWRLGQSEAKTVLESQGRFACEPQASGGTVTITPRVLPDKGTYYGMTAYSLMDDLEVPLAQLVMPSPVKPFDAVYIDDRFFFSVEASYQSGALLGSMGYYIGTKAEDIQFLGREPAANIACTGDLAFIKCRSFYYVANLAKKTYTALAAEDRCLEFGEYPARMGKGSNFVTFTTVVDAGTGYPSKVVVRVFNQPSD